PHYAFITQTYLNKLLSDWRKYINGVKFTGRSFSLIPSNRLKGLIETAHKHGKWRAGEDTSIAKLKAAGTKDPKWLIDRANKFLDTGIYMIMIKNKGITENVEKWRSNAVSVITSRSPKDKMMFMPLPPFTLQH
ncbi:hypothetical protein AN958_00465, partial [Leucoagaricus sp. SymC.cos]